MNNYLKQYIRDNIQLADSYEYELLYVNLKSEHLRGELTEFLLECDVKPDDYMRMLPSYYLYRSNVKTYSISSSVTHIDRYAFANCSFLTNVDIPSSVVNIDERAFILCEKLTSITIPDQVIKIGVESFNCCTSLENIKLGIGVREIGESAFLACSSITSLIIPDHVTTIGSRAFAGCSALKSVVIPNSIVSLGEEVFGGCFNLEVEFRGTKDQWKDLTSESMKYCTYTCSCTDGVVKKSR